MSGFAGAFSRGKNEIYRFEPKESPTKSYLKITANTQPKGLINETRVGAAICAAPRPVFNFASLFVAFCVNFGVIIGRKLFQLNIINMQYYGRSMLRMKPRATLFTMRSSIPAVSMRKNVPTSQRNLGGAIFPFFGSVFCIFAHFFQKHKHRHE